jgi:hypothetical protein
LMRILDLRNLFRQKGRELCGGRDTSVDTFGDQGCTSKTHAVSITQVMWIALHAVSHFQPWLVCNSTSSCPSLDHLLETKETNHGTNSPESASASTNRKCPAKPTDISAEPRLVAADVERGAAS